MRDVVGLCLSTNLFISHVITCGELLDSFSQFLLVCLAPN